MQKPLPKGWKWVKLGEVCEFVRGVTFDKSEVSKEIRNNYLPVLRAGNIKSSLDTVNDLLWVTEKQISDKQKLQVGDIVVCMSSGSSDVVGKTAQLKYPFIGSFGAFCGVIRAKNKEQIDYVAYWLGSSAYYKWRDGQARGVNIQNLKFSNFETIQIPLPPLPTQHKIVEILEEADNLRKLRRQADKKMKELIPSLFVQMFGDPATNLKGWEVKKLGEITKRVTAQILPTDSPDTEFFYIGLEHIESNTGALINANHQKGEGIKSNKNKFENGDILYGKLRPYLNKVWLADRNGICSTDIWVLRPIKKVTNGCFISTFLKFQRIVKMLNLKTEGANLPRVKAISFDKVSVPLPPLSLQQKFARLVEDIEAEKQRQAESRKKLDELFQSLMQRAFTGELVV
ncbi:MAG: restriction endonuclease subunit S [Nitrospirae bacterium]|nr:restriction endonuclease subunit S [Nitrospirota bacterium]